MPKPFSKILLALAFSLSAIAHASAASDEKPVPIERPAPRYSEDLRKKRIEGEVVAEFVIDIEGRVANATIIRSAHLALEAPALEAIRKWRFRPARKDGVPVATQVRQVLAFNLVDEAGSSPASKPRSRR